MSNSSSPIAEQVPFVPAQTPLQPLPLDAEWMKLVSGGVTGPNDSW